MGTVINLYHGPYVLSAAYQGRVRYCRVERRRGTLHTLSCGYQVRSPSNLYHPGAPMPCPRCTRRWKRMERRSGSDH